MTVELTGFLLARFAEEAGEARRVIDLNDWDTPEWNLSRWSPHRVLAECEARRRIVEHRTYETSELRPTTTPGRFDRVRVLVPYAADDEDLLRLLAMPYAYHPDYREEWRP